VSSYPAPLPIRIETEAGSPDRPTVSRLTARLRGLGPDNRWITASRSPYRHLDYIQAYRDDDNSFAVEYLRPGAPQLTTRVEEVDAVVELFVNWAHQTADWDAGHDWAPTGFTPSAPDPISPEDEEVLRGTLHKRVNEGFWTFDDIVQRTMDQHNELSVPKASVAMLLSEIWNARVEEEKTWPAVTDCKRLDEAFLRLREAGITAEQNFACCMRCGTAEIGADAPDTHRGYVFYHMQDTEMAAEGYGLHLAFGTYAKDADSVEIGRTVVKYLTTQGLRVDWDEQPSKRILISKLNWQRRLR